MSMNSTSLKIKAFILLFGCTSTFAVEKAPVEAFASLPALTAVHLSPNGKRFVAQYNNETHTLLLGREVSGKKLHGLVKSDNSKYRMKWVEWANDDRLAVSIRFPSRRYGIGVNETRLYKVSFEGGDFKPLVKSKREHQERTNSTGDWELVPQFQDNVIDWMRDDPDYFLLSAGFRNNSSESIYKVNVNGGRSMYERGRKGAYSWLVDQQHEPRVFKSYKDKQVEVFYQDLEKNKWYSAWNYEVYSEDVVEPLGFGVDPNKLFVNAYHQGYKAIFEVDLKTPSLDQELVYAIDGRDVEGKLLESPLTREIIGIDLGGQLEIWDERYQPFIAGIKKALKGRDVWLTDLSKSERQYVVFAESATSPGMYYFGDREKKRLFPIAKQYPKLQRKHLSENKMVEYKSRDGVMIEAVLTIPAGSDGENLPAIIFPHGGPIDKDKNGFNYWTQFFANRGYAVLQMNYRGSSGYGYEHMLAGLRDWGLQMHRDITDGTRWLISEGIADKDKICIVGGGSFGGYSSVLGLGLEPDIYRCGIGFAGIYDLKEFLGHMQWFVEKDIFNKQIGKKGEKVLEASPITYVNDISAPLLLVHGEKDRLVREKQSHLMVKAMKKAKKQFRYIPLENGTHELAIQKNRIAFFQAMDDFLAEHLPVD